LAAGDPIDVIVMDLALPGGISGVETLGCLREINPNVRAIACSGYLEAKSREAALRTGFAGVLSKPYTADRLAAVVRRALEG
jgi:DNA-binding NarL/FixJ family response regulator